MSERQQETSGPFITLLSSCTRDGLCIKDGAYSVEKEALGTCLSLCNGEPKSQVEAPTASLFLPCTVMQSLAADAKGSKIAPFPGTAILTGTASKNPATAGHPLRWRKAAVRLHRLPTFGSAFRIRGAVLEFCGRGT